MVNAGLRDVMPQFQSAGLIDSGAALQGALRTSADIRNQNAQFNVGALQNLVLGGQSSLQGQYQMGYNSLASQLQGLRRFHQNTTTKGMNPFSYAFEQGFGQKFGENLGQSWAQPFSPNSMGSNMQSLGGSFGRSGAGVGSSGAGAETMMG